MDDLRKQIKDYNQSVIDLAFGCQCDSCPRCKKTPNFCQTRYLTQTMGQAVGLRQSGTPALSQEVGKQDQCDCSAKSDWRSHVGRRGVERVRIDTQKKSLCDVCDKVHNVSADAIDATPESITYEGHGRDIFTEAKFGDCVIELELMVPLENSLSMELEHA